MKKIKNKIIHQQLRTLGRLAKALTGLFHFKKNETMRNLFDMDEIEPEWKKEWKDMPEFVQDKIEPYAKIIIRFDNEADLQDFAKLIGQKLTKKTKIEVLENYVAKC